MVVHLEPNPAEQISRLAAEIRRVGDGRVIVNEMTKRIRRSAGPIRKAVKASAVTVLPSGGGLGAWVARSSVRVAVRRGTRSAGVAVVGGRRSTGGRTHLRRIDAGKVRAPYYGHRTAWHLQAVTPGFFTKPMEARAGAFRDEVVEAVNEAERKVFG